MSDATIFLLQERHVQFTAVAAVENFQIFQLVLAVK
jgi:hypothetical protein